MSRSPISTRSPSQMAAARKITFCSWRTLPGQGLASSAEWVAGVSRQAGRWICVQACCMKKCASIRMSWPLSRSGGTCRLSTFRR
ncbi:hypothetical protein D3C79_895440 [compost metagenome]